MHSSRQLFSTMALLIGLGAMPQSLIAGHYDLQLIAETGQLGLTTMGRGPSVNRNGKVAFVGRLANTEDGKIREGIFLGDGTSLNQVNTAQTVDFSFGDDVQMSDADQIVARDFAMIPVVGILTPFTAVRGWGPSPGPSFTVIDREIGFGGVLESPSISDNGTLVAYARYWKDGGRNITTIKTFSTQSGTYGENLYTMNTPRVHYRPMCSGDGRTAFRIDDPPSSPIGLIIDPAQTAWQGIATSARGPFTTRLGLSPGVTGDGAVVAFAGQRDGGGTPGIYISIQNQPNNNRSSRSILRVAGESAGRDPANPDLGRDGSGRAFYFEDFAIDSRVGVLSMPNGTDGIEDDAIVICFIGTPNRGADGILASGNAIDIRGTPGIWTVRGTIKRSAADPNQFEFRRESILPVIQVGDSLINAGGLGIDDLAINDPISLPPPPPGVDRSTYIQNHYIGFWAASGAQNFIVRALGGGISMHRVSDPAMIANLGAGIDVPLELRAAPKDLASQPRINSGLVADGVTPLLFMIQHAAQSQPVTKNVTISVEDDPGGMATLLQSRFRVLDHGRFAPATTISFAARQTSAYAYLAAITPTELVFPAGKSELRARLIVTSGASSVTKEFKLRKPPIVLVHGYNANSSTWTDSFLDELRQARSPDFVIPIDYGVNRFPGNEDGEPDNTENIEGRLDDLAHVLDDVLKTQIENRQNPIHQRWAMTRYDAVCHSQGGVLTRMLCAKNPIFSSPFVHPSNLNRGRFNRVVTIGSPHNGSLLLYWILQLFKRPEIYYGKVVPALLGSIAKPKFSPFDDPTEPNDNQFSIVNSAAYAPDPRAKILCVRTTVADGFAPQLNHCTVAYEALGLCWPPFSPAGAVLLPRGSDGVVDYDSQVGAGNMGATINGYNISHADVPLLFSSSLGGHGQPTDPIVAGKIADLLDDPANFDTFHPPQPLSPALKATIDALIPGTITGFIIRHLPPPFPAFAPSVAEETNSETTLRFTIDELSFEPVDGKVTWMSEVYGPGGVSQKGIRLEPDPDDNHSVTVVVSSSVVGDVVLYASYRSANGTLVFGNPLLVASRPAAGQLARIESVPPAAALSVGSSLSLEIWGVYTNGIRTRLYIPPGTNALLASSNPAVARILPDNRIQVTAQGVATISVSYSGFMTQMVVSNRPPVARIAEIQRPSTGGVILTIVSSSGSTNRIETSSDLSRWSPQGFVYNTNGISDYHDPDTSRATKFYRVVVE